MNPKLFALVGVILLAHVPLKAQDPDSITHRNNCRLAAQVITTGHPAVKAEWANVYVRTCPAAATELAAALTRARNSTDTTYLNRLTAPTDWMRDGRLYSSALSVARDRAASTPARIFAIRTLVWSVAPGGELEYEHLVDGDHDGVWSCGGLGPSGHGELLLGNPMPQGWVEQARAAGRALMDSPEEPAPVREAATCLAVAIPSDVYQD